MPATVLHVQIAASNSENNIQINDLINIDISLLRLKVSTAVVAPRGDWGTYPLPLLAKVNFIIRPNSMGKF